MRKAGTFGLTEGSVALPAAPLAGRWSLAGLLGRVRAVRVQLLVLLGFLGLAVLLLGSDVDLAGDPDARGRRRRPRALRLVPALDAVRGRAPHLALRQRLPQPPRRHQPHVEHLDAAAGPAAVAADPAPRPGAGLQPARHPGLRPLGLERLPGHPPLRAQPRRGRLRRAGLRLLAGDGRSLPPPQPDPDPPPAVAVRPARRDPRPPAPVAGLARGGPRRGRGRAAADRRRGVRRDGAARPGAARPAGGGQPAFAAGPGTGGCTPPPPSP